MEQRENGTRAAIQRRKAAAQRSEARAGRDAASALTRKAAALQRQATAWRDGALFSDGPQRVLEARQASLNDLSAAMASQQAATLRRQADHADDCAQPSWLRTAR